MSFNIAGIGVGEGGGRIAMSMVDMGINISCLNTNEGDLKGLSKIPESKKLLIDISSGGSGKDPLFVKKSIANTDIRKKIIAFIKKMLDTTPVFTNCPECNSKEKIKDTEAVGDKHECSVCEKSFGITQVEHEPSIKHDYLFLFVCLGGGSGSGLIGEVIDICSTSPEINIPIAVVCTLPDDSEDTTTKTNAISIFKELYNVYATKEIISPLILVDNQKMQESFNLPVGSQYVIINNSITSLIDKFNSFSNQTSPYMSTIDTMDTARLWSIGGCCSIGKFIVGKSSKQENKGQLSVPHPLALEELEEAMKQCTFVDGFDLSTAKGIGIIAVAPDHFLQDENVSKCIRFAFGKAKEIIGDGLVFRGQYNNQNTDCLEFYLFYNGLLYPEERFARMWQDIKDGKVISEKKRNRIDEVSYDVHMESNSSGKNFKKLQNIGQNIEEQVEIRQVETIRPKQVCNNCFIDPMTKQSMGIYKRGGPRPFPLTEKICPICQGRGKI